MKWWPVFLIASITAWSCRNPHPGFEESASGIWRRMDHFGDCRPPLAGCEYFIAEVTLRNLSHTDSMQFTIYNGSLKPRGGYGRGFGNPVSVRLFQEMKSLQCGDGWTYIIPFSDISGSYFSAYDSKHFAPDEKVELQVKVLQTFERKSWMKYLCSASRLKEISEWEAIQMTFLNDTDFSSEVHGDVFIRKILQTEGDSIKAGREVEILYNTYLLDGTLLDDSTTMRFQFGKPAQLVSGLSYGLSFLRQGERAQIYMPSYLAFGEEGNSSGLVPPRTPVYFDVQVLNVRQFPVNSGR